MSHWHAFGQGIHTSKEGSVGGGAGSEERGFPSCHRFFTPLVVMQCSGTWIVFLFVGQCWIDHWFFKEGSLRVRSNEKEVETWLWGNTSCTKIDSILLPPSWEKNNLTWRKLMEAHLPKPVGKAKSKGCWSNIAGGGELDFFVPPKKWSKTRSSPPHK